MTDRAQLPALRLPQGVGNKEQDDFNRAVLAWFQLREGQVGAGQERMLTRRDLATLGLPDPAYQPGGPANRASSSSTLVKGINSSEAAELAGTLLSTRMFRDLITRLDDPTRFHDLDERLQFILRQSIADMGIKLGASVRDAQDAVQNESKSRAIALREVTAGLGGALAGVRVLQAATAQQGRATATEVTQVQARLDDFDGGGATVETVLLAVADQITGLLAEYIVKVSAGGAIAGIMLAAEDAGTGSPSSAFIVMADRFAVVDPAYAGGLDLTPDANNVPFSIDAGTGEVRIKGNLMVAGSIHAAAVGAGEIQATHMAADSITAANGAIANLTVGTLKIQDQAITAPAISVVTTSSGLTPSFVTKASVSIDGDGAEVFIATGYTGSAGGSLGASGESSYDGAIEQRILVNGSAIYTGTPMTGFTFTSTGGTDTVALQFRDTGGFSNGSINHCWLQAVAYKK